MDCKNYFCQEQRECICDYQCVDDLPVDEFAIGDVLTAENFAPLARIRALRNRPEFASSTIRMFSDPEKLANLEIAIHDPL